jgi:hypothetical protein
MRRVVDAAWLAVGLFAVLSCSSKAGSDDPRLDDAKALAGSSAGGYGGTGSGGKSGAGGGGSSAQGGGGGKGGSAGNGTGAAAGAAGSAGGATPAGAGGNGGAAAGRAGASGKGGAQGGSAGSPGTKYTLTVEFVGSVPGEFANLSHGFSCDENCSRTLPDGHEDTYRAQPKNGTGTYFAGFGGDCTGIGECSITMDRDKSITLEFRPQTHNFVFLSSRGDYTSHGGAVNFDVNCNELAKDAGINNETFDAYVAWVSDEDSLALDRLGTTARGWVRLDGKPVVDTVEDLLAGKFLHTIRLDETGMLHDNEIVGTGTLADGSAAPDNCNNWQSEATGVLYDFAYGKDSGGPTYWTESGVRPCNIGIQFYCFGKTFSEPIVPVPEEGKLIYLSEPYVPNVDTTPDEACAASAPSGAGEVLAMLAYRGKAGADVLSNETKYVRPDGQLVGLGAEIVEAAAPGVQATVDNYLRTGIWQTGDGTYLNEADSAVWVGDINITREGAGDCDDFTTSTSSATVGDYRDTGSGFWDQEYGDRYRDCGTPHRFYCVEQ